MWKEEKEKGEGGEGERSWRALEIEAPTISDLHRSDSGGLED